ncbi:hypothetical protein [Brachybacterium sp. GPGPB12]
MLDGEGLTLSSISMTRNSVVDVENGEENLADARASSSWPRASA